MNEKDTKLCYICGNGDADSDDHVPPKSIFHRKFWDNNLITVPAHKTCNRSYSKDDEYFRDNIVLAASSTNDAAKELFDDKMIRAFQREQAKGYRKMFLKQMSTVEVRSPSGIFLKKLPIKTMDSARIDSVIERICRGLYYYTHQKILPLNCSIEVNMLKPEAIRIKYELVGKPILKTLIADIFEYVMLSDKNDAENNLFYMFFYNCFAFHISTGQIAEKRKLEPKDIEKYDKLEGIQFTDETLWFPPETSFE